MPRRRPLIPVCVVAVPVALLLAAGCGSSSPRSSDASDSGEHPSQAQLQQEQQHVVAFADCMRSHRVPNFPDPTTSPREFKQSLDPSTAHSPAFHSAVLACGHLLPRQGQNPSPAHSQARIAAALAFARCIRSHGFPSFPDPSRSGDISHQMLASAGIDLHQPGVVKAGEACASVTHGLITRSDVARFVAGQ